jgi:hypothetical protein
MNALDIWRSAQLLITQHGTDAELVAARRVDEAIAAGAPKSETIWKNVLAAVRDLQRKTPRNGEGVH